MTQVTDYNEAIKILETATSAVGAIDGEGTLIEVFFFQSEPDEGDLDDLFEDLAGDDEFLSLVDERGFTLIDIAPEDFPKVLKGATDALKSQKQTFN